MTTKPLDVEMNIVKVTLADDSQRSFRVPELAKKSVGELLRELRGNEKFPYKQEEDALLFEYMPPNKKLKREQWLQELSEREPVKNVVQRWGGDGGGVTLVLKPRSAAYPPRDASGVAPKKSVAPRTETERPLKQDEHKDAKMKERADKHWARSKDELGKELLLTLERNMSKDGLYKYDVKRDATIEHSLAELQGELAGGEGIRIAAQCREHEKLLVAYINTRLKPRGLFVSNLHSDIKSAVPLIALVEELAGTKLLSAVRDPRGRRECIHNGNQLVKLLGKLGVEAHPILIGTDFYEGKISLVYGTLYMLVKRSIELGFDARKKEYAFDDAPPRRAHAADASDSDSDDRGPRTATGGLVGATSARFRRPEDAHKSTSSSATPAPLPRRTDEDTHHTTDTHEDDESDEGWEEVSDDDVFLAATAPAPAPTRTTPALTPAPAPTRATRAPAPAPVKTTTEAASSARAKSGAGEDDVLESLLSEMEELNVLSPRSQVLAALETATPPPTRARRTSDDRDTPHTLRSPRAVSHTEPAHKTSAHAKPRVAAAAALSPRTEAHTPTPSHTHTPSTTTVDEIQAFLQQPLPPAPAPSVSAVVQATHTVPTLLPGAPPSLRAVHANSEGELMQTDEGIVLVPRGLELVMTPQGMMLIPEGQSAYLVQLEDGTLMLQPPAPLFLHTPMAAMLGTPSYGSVPLSYEYEYAQPQAQSPVSYTHAPPAPYAAPTGALYSGNGFGGSNVLFGMDPGLTKRGAQPAPGTSFTPHSTDVPRGRTPAGVMGSAGAPSTPAASAAKYDMDAVLANTRSAVERSRSAKHPATGLGNTAPGSRLPPSNNPPGMM